MWCWFNLFDDLWLIKDNFIKSLIFLWWFVVIFFLILLDFLGFYISLFEALTHTRGNCIEDKRPFSERFSMILANGLFNTSQILIINVSKAFEVSILPVPNHPYIIYDPAWTKLFSNILLVNIIGKVFHKQSFASYWNRHRLNYLLFLPFSRMNIKVSGSNFLTIF